MYFIKAKINYKASMQVTKIDVLKRSFSKALNQGLNSNVNEITIIMKREYKILFFFNKTEWQLATGVMDVKHDIHNYLKVGDTFDASEYPMLKIGKSINKYGLI